MRYVILAFFFGGIIFGFVTHDPTYAAIYSVAFCIYSHLICIEDKIDEGRHGR